MARFHTLSIEATLFSQTCLVRRWGRIGTHGRCMQHSFDGEGEAVGLFLQLFARQKDARLSAGLRRATRISGPVGLTGPLQKPVSHGSGGTR